MFGKEVLRSANELKHRGLPHFVASDAHDAHHRSPSLREAYGMLAHT